MDRDPAIRLWLRRRLAKAGHSVQDVEPGEVIPEESVRQFDLLILDVDLPEEGGVNLIRAIRDASAMPILALSSRGDEDTAITALKTGADDLVRKPFGIEELLARAENALRRRAREQGQHVRVAAGSIEIDLWHRRVYSQGVEVHLPVKEYEVLRVLAENADRVVARNDLLGTVWGDPDLKRLWYLRQAIRALRRKLEPYPSRPQYILTETCVGYRLWTQAPAGSSGHRRSLEPVEK
jgi:two-component system, OmpR family, KDP operon response regulator KdpE